MRTAINTSVAHFAELIKYVQKEWCVLHMNDYVCFTASGPACGMAGQSF